MVRIAIAVVLFSSTALWAQAVHDPAHMNHGAMQHQGKAQPQKKAPATLQKAPTQAGQAAFAAIQEVVQILEADPQTNWSKVDIEALRQHLIDMNNVTLSATVTASPVESGVRYTVTGTGAVRDSIRRMVSGHATTMNGIDGWTFNAAQVEDGSMLTVTVPPRDLPKVKALGFIGLMAHGMHHQEHHLMIARGDQPHH